MALNWESIGRIVRRETLEAVSSHFAATAVADRDAMSRGPASEAVVTDGSDGTGGGLR